MYEDYWSLADKPFRNTPDPHYFYFSRRHEEALTRALYALTEGQGAMMLTGECGCGKTLLTRAIVDELDPDRFEVALLPYPNLSPDEFLAEVLRQFGYDPAGWDKSTMLLALGRFLEATHRRGASTLVIVDEGQVIQDPLTLEEIRLLLNFQQDRKHFLTLLVAGQPELRERVEERPQLAQRLAVRYHVGAMDEDDAVAYLRHRLAVAGGASEIFTGGAERLIARASEGVPRRVNHLADTALLAAFGKREALVDEGLVRRIIDDMVA